jgi:hypothetical protein
MGALAAATVQCHYVMKIVMHAGSPKPEISGVDSNRLYPKKTLCTHPWCLYPSHANCEILYASCHEHLHHSFPNKSSTNPLHPLESSHTEDSSDGAVHSLWTTLLNGVSNQSDLAVTVVCVVHVCGDGTTHDGIICWDSQ